MNRRDNPEEKLVERVGVRFTSTEHSRLLAMAKQHGLTLSKFVRAMVVGKRIKTKIEANIIDELRRQGGLLKHLAQTTPINQKEVAAALSDLRDTFVKIGNGW